MLATIRESSKGATPRLALGVVLLAISLALPAASRAAELIPSIIVGKSTDSNAGDPKLSGGLALRAPLFPFLKVEGGIAYHEDSYFGDNLKVRQWPVTASAWLTPAPMVYAGGGVGWYRTTYDFSSSLPQADNTQDKLGVHAGAGLLFPIAPKVSLDLNGRYIWMQNNNEDFGLPTKFNPDYWNASAGLAFQF